MPQFMLTYVGSPNQPSTPEEGKKHMAEYKTWLGGLGKAAISPMNPLKNTCLLNPDASVTQGGITGMSGYTIIEAESMEAALELAKACPYLAIGGTLEVAEKIEM